MNALNKSDRMDPDKRVGHTIGKMLVTIDGSAGSGKSTTASMLAEELGLTYLDTGAMYRAVTWDSLENGISPEDEAAVTERAGNIDLELREAEGVPSLFLNGRRLGNEIRSSEVSAAVSPVSKYSGVRRSLVKIQRSIALKGGIVAEGRDTGTTVFPFADLKIFLTADIGSRALRRKNQLEEMELEGRIESIRENLENRDRIDSTREHSPLRRPPGSITVDTSNITIEEQVGIIKDAVVKKAEELSRLRVWPGEKNEKATMPLYWRSASACVYFFFKIIFGLRTYGRDNISYRENYIFASNHISNSDPPIVGSALKRKVWILAKKELFGNFFFRWLITRFNAIPVDRGKADRMSVTTITEKLVKGDSVLLFPEGTRSRDGNIRKLKSGLGYYAIQTGRPIVPVFIRGCDRLKDCFLRKEKMEVHIGRPIRIDAGYESSDKKSDYETLASMTREEMSMLKYGPEN